MKTMLEILKNRLPEGLCVVGVKETHNKYDITFKHEGDVAKAELRKTCAPGCADSVADTTIITAMSTICFNRGDLVGAKNWLRRITDKSAV